MWDVEIGSSAYWVWITLFCFGIYGLVTLLVARFAERRGATKRCLVCLIASGFALSIMVASLDPGFGVLGVFALMVLIPATLLDLFRSWFRVPNRVAPGDGHRDGVQ
jgi:hypothetical protein